MTNWFFLSHANFDRENDKNGFIKRFYEELRSTVQSRRGPDAQAFIDAEEIELGDHYDLRLDRALSTCRVLVCMYSRTYFQRKFCGQEFQTFYDRLRNSDLPDNEKLPLILPVLLTDPEGYQNRPLITQKIQDKFDAFPEDYKENGLLYLMARKTKEEDYLNFLNLFASRLIKVAEENVLSEAAKVVSVETAVSAWEVKAPSGGKARNSGSGLNDTVEYADFVFAAARRSEIETLPETPQIERYGDKGGIDWIPYRPDLMQPVGQFVQAVAAREGFYYQALELNRDLIKQIKKARFDSRIVIIIVDTWTLALNDYYEILNEYDDYDPLNCSMIIVWNNKDEFTMARREKLENYILSAFPIKSTRSANLVFVNNIGSQKDFEDFLSKALHELKAQILRVNQNFRTIESGGSIPMINGT